jgi:hypothetical protein
MIFSAKYAADLIPRTLPVREYRGKPEIILYDPSQLTR